ncbi:MAG: hypothetical protein HOY79_06100 [Streptomyces sp.]|nr:hypothetical protein [Streptomyces sp.]
MEVALGVLHPDRLRRRRDFTGVAFPGPGRATKAPTVSGTALLAEPCRRGSGSATSAVARSPVSAVLSKCTAEEVRFPAAVDPPHEKVSEEEIEGTLALIGGMTRDDLEGPELTYAYTEAMAKIIEAKREESR